MRSIATLLALSLALVACSDGGAGEASEPRELEANDREVLVFAVDGFEWDVILPLVRQGRMPNLVGLIERGAAGTLSTHMPNKSPRLWTTIATGKVPTKHGILDFVKRGEGRGPKARHYTSADRKVKAFWNVLSDAGVTNDTIGWWMTYPVEPVNGLMVAQTNTYEGNLGLKKGRLVEGQGEQVWPVEREPDVFATLERNDERLDELVARIFGDVGSDLRASQRRRWEQCRWAFRADSTYASVLADRLSRGERSQVTSIFVGGTDIVGHRFWAAYRPGELGLSRDSDEVRLFGRVIPAYYEYVDELLGRLLASFPDDVTVLVVADHGMGAVRHEEADGIDLDRFTGGHDDSHPGFFLACGPGIEPRALGPLDELRPEDAPLLGDLTDFCPTLLALLGLPYGEDMDGRPIEAILAAEVRGSIASIATHDDDSWLATRGRVVEHEDEARIEQLKELGYLGDDEDE